MTEEETKILRLMNEITSRTDMSEFAKKTNLTPDQIVTHMQQLAKKGLLKKVGGGFAMTEKGKNVLKADVLVPENKKFHFYVAIDHPIGVSAGTIKEFYELTSKIDSASLEFHLYRGDFENWFRTTADDTTFADKLAEMKQDSLNGEELRKTMVKAAKLRFAL